MDELVRRIEESTSREVWAKDGLFVSINRTGSGGVEFKGHDLNSNPFGTSEYEYVLTVSGDRTFDLIDGMGGQPGDDPLDLVEAQIDTIIRMGELTWLRSLGIDPGFWSAI